VTRGKDRIFDEYLVASAKAGDRRAFAMLVERWQGKLLAHAWRLTGDVEAARDSAQAAWVEIVRGFHLLRDDRAFPAWAYRLVSRKCANQIRGAIRRRELDSALAAEPEPELPGPDIPLEAKQLRSAIAMLPPDQRAAIALFYLEDMSVAEVAVALDVPMGTIKTRLMHARSKLRAAMEGE
jgi:RNA polymerase sigma-70 factor (ECF subfamily)